MWEMAYVPRAAQPPQSQNWKLGQGSLSSSTVERGQKGGQIRTLSAPAGQRWS